MIKNGREKLSHKCADITRYRNTYLIFGTLTRMPSHVAVVWCCFRWRRVKNCNPIVQNLTPNIIKYVFKGYKLSEIEQNIYSYIIKGLSHWNRWILSLIGTSTNARKLVSFDIPTLDNIHRYQCNNPILLFFHLVTLKWNIAQRSSKAKKNCICVSGFPTFSWFLPQHIIFYWIYCEKCAKYTKNMGEMYVNTC